MHRFDRMHLSPEVAMRTAEKFDREEKSKLAEWISVIAVIDHRRDYLAAGYSCTLSYCRERLHMSEDRALKRIQVARVALRFPEIFECLADGRLSVSTASLLAPKLEPETAADLLAGAAFRTRQEILRLLDERSRPVAGPSIGPEGEPNVQDTSESHAPGHVNSLADLCAPSAGDATPGSLAPAQANNPRRGRVLTSPTGGYEARLSLTDEEHDQLRRATALLGHAVPSGDPALVYARAMEHYLAHLEKQRLGKRLAVGTPTDPAGTGSPAPTHKSTSSGSRSIPKTLCRFVWERDGGCCAFTSANGHRCGSTTRLELDHITPIAQGGKTTPENLRLLCRAHNQYEAGRLLGKDHVQRKRDLARFERAKAQAAARGSAARAKVRDETRQARHDDLEAALLGLGFKQADALRGAALADAMPDASLEACLKQALIMLTRPMAARGERMARCTA